MFRKKAKFVHLKHFSLESFTIFIQLWKFLQIYFNESDTSQKKHAYRISNVILKCGKNPKFFMQLKKNGFLDLIQSGQIELIHCKKSDKLHIYLNLYVSSNSFPTVKANINKVPIDYFYISFLIEGNTFTNCYISINTTIQAQERFSCFQQHLFFRAVLGSQKKWTAQGHPIYFLSLHTYSFLQL